MKPLFRLHDAVTDLSYAIAVAGLMAMVTIYCTEVITRYFLGTALDWANDTFSNVLCVTIFAAAPHVARIAGHIEINLVPELLPLTRTPLRVFGALTSAAVCGLVTWMSLQENMRQIAMGLMTLQNHPVPIFWISGFITYGFASSTVYFIRALLPGDAARPTSFVAPVNKPEDFMAGE